LFHLQKMKTNLIKTLILLALSCLAATAAQGQLKRVTTKTDTLDFGAGGTVAIMGAPNGSIRVEPSAGNQIEITAEVSLEASTEADLTTLANITGYVTEESLGKVTINSVGPHDAKYVKRIDKKFPKRLMGATFSIDYLVKVPRYCDLQIDAGKGDITIRGVEGSLRINSLESNAKLDLVGGTLNATFAKGNISLTIPERSWRGSGLDVALANGSMEVYFPINLSAELDASVLRTGKIENSLIDLKPRVRTQKFTDTLISAKAGSGGVPMKFTVGDGTLKLKMIGKE
jgi:hypothetical protein